MKHAMSLAAGVVCALLALPASAANAPSPDPAIAQKLIGAWNLIEIRERDAATGAEKPATPASAGGQLIYTANGRLSLQIARQGWEKTGVNGFASYFGRWELVPAEGYVIHHQDGNLNAKQVGQAAKRYYAFDAQGHLALATPPARSPDGRMVSTVFVWERFQ
jgi:amidase